VNYDKYIRYNCYECSDAPVHGYYAGSNAVPASADQKSVTKALGRVKYAVSDVCGKYRLRVALSGGP
jgi:hypothetical protein